MIEQGQGAASNSELGNLFTYFTHRLRGSPAMLMPWYSTTSALCLTQYQIPSPLVSSTNRCYHTFSSGGLTSPLPATVLALFADTLLGCWVRQPRDGAEPASMYAVGILETHKCLLEDC